MNWPRSADWLTTSNTHLTPATPSEALFDGLKALEADLHVHIHLENNILFPRAIALEQRQNLTNCLIEVQCRLRFPCSSW